MLVWIYGLFLLAHGIAHLVYTSLAMGWITQADVNSTWSGSSWLLSNLFGNQATRFFGAVIFAAITFCFAVAGAAWTFRQPWAPAWTTGVAIASIATIVLFWDGSLEDLVSKGLIGLLINAVLLVGLYVLHFPSL